jgi:uncharacterized protein YndB with AHSA1/START domain
MTITAVCKDPAALTMRLVAEFDASQERFWQLWADPRQLERWWGPPTPPPAGRFAAKLGDILAGT